MKQKVETATSPREKLADFLRSHVREGVDIEHSVSLIVEALARFDHPLLQNKDIALKAQQLEEAAERFAKALKSVCVVEEGGDIAREGPESVWPFLRIAELMGPQGFFDNAASALRYGKSSPEARRFDVAAGKVPALLHSVRTVERQARIARKVFTQPGHPQNALATRLLIELEVIWKQLTGKKASYSGATDFGAPRTHFSKFVRYALGIISWPEAKQRSIFSTVMGGRKRRR